MYTKGKLVTLSIFLQDSYKKFHFNQTREK